MGKGESAKDRLIGKGVQAKLGIIGVVNRSQEEVDRRQSVEECIADEAEFFRRHHPELSNTGVPFLRTALNKVGINIFRHVFKAGMSKCILDFRTYLSWKIWSKFQILIEHILRSLPSVELALQKIIEDKEGQLGDFADGNTDKTSKLVEVLREFEDELRADITGGYRRVQIQYEWALLFTMNPSYITPRKVLYYQQYKMLLYHSLKVSVHPLELLQSGSGYGDYDSTSWDMCPQKITWVTFLL